MMDSLSVAHPPAQMKKAGRRWNVNAGLLVQTIQDAQFARQAIW
jgi:hypothetical protein